MRNAIYFDEEFLARENPQRRYLRKVQGWLAMAGALNCEAVIYPSKSMRELVESRNSQLAALGKVNYYGISQNFLEERGREAKPPGVDRKPQPANPEMQRATAPKETYEFRYVMTYTLQKNLTYLLTALAQARREKLPVRVILTSNLESGSPATFNLDWDLINTNRLLEDGYLELGGSA